MFRNVANWLVDPTGLTPHGFCLLWEPGLLWTHAVSDAAIGLAYFTIPIALLIVARHRRDLVFRPLFVLFAAFILLCGTGHWFDVLTLWVPAYGLQAVVKVATAVTSVVTAIALWWLLPQALALPSPAQVRRVNEALRESEARHRVSFERSPVPLHTLDGDGVITGVSDSWLALLGYRHDEVVGRPIQQFWVPGAENWDTTDKPRLLQDGVVQEAEQRYQRRDGRQIDALVSSRLEPNGDAVWVVCVLVDITARRQAEAALRSSEERLRQVHKMEAVGQLTGGIAHDFNNMLQGIGGCLELMERRIAEGRTSDLSRYIGPARQSVDRAAGLTNRMLAFARRQTLQPRTIDANKLMSGMADLIRYTAGPSIEVNFRLQEPVDNIWCDAGQLESGVLNLIVNAREAMPDGGSLTITTADRVLDSSADELGLVEQAANQSSARSAEYVEIAVSDTGLGMRPEVMARAFEPFFTTKPIGQGTGLGLSQLYGFIRQSGGLVRLESMPHKGTTVRLLLPRDRSGVLQVAALQSDQDQPNQLRVGPISGTVLVVEDEANVRSLIAEVMQDLGCRVLEAGDGTEGLRVVQSQTDVTLLITDIGLPGLNGRELAQAAREVQKRLPVLLITGFSGHALDEYELAPGMEMLRKPFAVETLAERVRGLLSASVV